MAAGIPGNDVRSFLKNRFRTPSEATESFAPPYWNATMWCVFLVGGGMYLAFTLPKIDRAYMAEEAAYVGYVNNMVGAIDLRAVDGAHPPLYIHLLRLGYSISGGRAYGLRLVGLLSTLSTFVFVYLIGSFLCKGARGLRHGVALGSVALFALLPTTIQGTLHLDIDTTVLPLVSTAFLWGFLRISIRKSRPLSREVIILGVIYGVGLWTKFTFLPFPIVAILLYYALCRRVREGVSLALSVFVVGSLIFFLPYMVLKPDGLLQIFEYTLRHSNQLVVAPTLGLTPLLALLELPRRARSLVLWLWPLVLPFIVIVVSSARNYLKKKEPTPIDFLLLYAGIYLVVYSLGQNMFLPRYYYPAIPLLCIAVVGLASHYLVERSNLSVAWTAASSIFIAGLLYYLYVGDYLDLASTFRMLYLRGEMGLVDENKGELGLVFIVAMPLFLGALWLIWLGRRAFWVGFAGQFAAISIPIVLASSLALDFLQFRADYVTTYPYGIRGQPQALRYLADHSADSIMYLNYYPLTFYLGQGSDDRPVFVYSTSLQQDDVQCLSYLFNAGIFEWLVFSPIQDRHTAAVMRSPDIREALEANYSLVFELEHPNSFEIFRRIGQAGNLSGALWHDIFKTVEGCRPR